MLTWVDRRRTRYAAFVLLLLAIHAVDGVLVRSAADSGRRSMVAMGATIDVVVVVSALYYWLLVRPGMRTAKSLIVIALAGVLHATYFYPNGQTVRATVAGTCEAALAGFVGIHVARKLRRTAGSDADPVEAIRAAVGSLPLTAGMTRLIAAEVSTLYYALFSWRSKPHIALGARGFSIHERAGQADLFGVVAIACLIELVPAHLVLSHWSRALAWAVTGLSLYGAICLTGVARAFRLRPVLLGPDYLHFRYGLLFDLRVPKQSIAAVRRAGPADGKFALPRRTEPRLCVEFTHHVDAEGPFGICRRVDRIAFTADDEPAFRQALAEMLR